MQARLISLQREQQMCVHKKELTELDIYHRILRFKNYTVAMVNKSLLPVRFRLPLLGHVVFLTQGLKYNLELLLFWGPGSLFQNKWNLQPQYKRAGSRLELAQRLARTMVLLGLANLLLCPFVLVWQVLYAFFSYTEVIKREPGSLGARRWSLYGRHYLRHFNELNHELQARLSRGYKPATKYMNSFTSPLLTVLAKNVGFFAGSILAVLIVLTVYDEDVLTVQHILTAITLLGLVVTLARWVRRAVPSRAMPPAGTRAAWQGSDAHPCPSGPSSLTSTWCGARSSCCSASWRTSTTCPTTGRATPASRRRATRWRSSSSTRR